MSKYAEIPEEGMVMFSLSGLSNEQLIKCEDLILNLPECNRCCPGDCPSCSYLIDQAVEQGYLNRLDINIDA